jgi:hypothetical protein
LCTAPKDLIRQHTASLRYDTKRPRATCATNTIPNSQTCSNFVIASTTCSLKFQSVTPFTGSSVFVLTMHELSSSIARAPSHVLFHRTVSKVATYLFRGSACVGERWKYFRAEVTCTDKLFNCGTRMRNSHAPSPSPASHTPGSTARDDAHCCSSCSVEFPVRVGTSLHKKNALEKFR